MIYRIYFASLFSFWCSLEKKWFMIFILVWWFMIFVHSLCGDVFLYFQFVSDEEYFLKKKKWWRSCWKHLSKNVEHMKIWKCCLYVHWSDGLGVEETNMFRGFGVKFELILSLFYSWFFFSSIFLLHNIKIPNLF